VHDDFQTLQEGNPVFDAAGRVVKVGSATGVLIPTNTLRALRRAGGLSGYLGTPTGEATLTIAEDYEAHLEVLGIFAEYFIQGFLYAYEIDVLHNYAETYPDNALFSALYHAFSDGDQSNAVRILLTEKWFPANRLPKDTDRFTHYLFQRDPGLDWEPCGTEGRPCEGLTHTAIDFHFVYWILTTDFRSL
jgi:hypothetical protein